jgi:hypothetical protein
MGKPINDWLQTLGYDGSVGVVHRNAGGVRPDHPYAREIELLLGTPGAAATAVFEVDRVPAVCFVEPEGDNVLDASFIDDVRSRIWNQNLVSILVVVRGKEAIAYPAPRELDPERPLSLAQVNDSGPFSANEIARGDIYSRLPRWFERKSRVDRVLQDNLAVAVQTMSTGMDLSVEQAQLLLGKCIFVSYLEHRGIVGNHYRERHGVGRLLDLLKSADGRVLDKLFQRLKADFNGDLLEIEGGSNVAWTKLTPQAFDLLAQFLQQTRLRDRQASLWPYDFQYIPVELLSGIYETFLGSAQRSAGAFYTPRHLAALAIDEAFRGIDEPWREVVLDGACGSGILLTSAYRRMLGAKRAALGRALTYDERRDILLSGIRGGDTSTAACKVTAFSLYLALLEDLSPSDIARLQDDQDVRLPELRGEVLTRDGQGDFFSSRNPIARDASASVVISNPPWFEPETDAEPSYERWWAKTFESTLPRRQVALAFARRASQVVKPGGRVCLILPVSTLAAAAAGDYLKAWFREVAPQRIFNLADMRFVLFDGAIHPTAVFTGVRRQPGEQRIPARETFEYLVPKADISLAFGRLTAHSSDRKRLSTFTAADDPEVLRTYFWGTELDESLIARLRLYGTIEDHARGQDARLVICKGFHKTDNAKDPSPSRPLHRYKFLRTAIGASNFPKDRLFVHHRDLEDFPTHEIKTVADYGSKDGQAFEGERVLFTDGVDNKTMEVRACFTDKPFCFTQTVSAIVDKKRDSSLMLFLAAYLRSKLARYLLFYTSFSLTMERPHVKLREIERLPLPLPHEHANSEQALRVVQKVAQISRPFQVLRSVEDNEDWSNARDALDELVYDYFELTSTERTVVNDTCEYLIPSRQPTTFENLRSPLQAKPAAGEFGTYARLLRSELENWRERLDGEGHFRVELSRPTSTQSGSVGVVRISLNDKLGAHAIAMPKIVEDILEQLRGDDPFPQVGSEAFSVSSDLLLFHHGDYYFVKPLVRRLWLATAAAQDAYRIVQIARYGTSLQ